MVVSRIANVAHGFCTIVFMPAFLLPAYAEHGSEPSLPARISAAARREQLLNALQSKVTSRRAAEEGAAMTLFDRRAIEPLLTRIHDDLKGASYPFPSPRLTDALLSIGPSAISTIVEHLQHPGLPREEVLFLQALLGRLGTKGREPCESLNRILNDPKCDETMKSSIRLILAHLQKRWQDARVITENALARKPLDADALNLAATILWLGPSAVWLDARLIDKLGTKSLEDPNTDGVHAAALFLGSQAARARTLGPALRKRYDCLIHEGNPVALTVGLALGRIDPNKSNDTLDVLLKNWDKALGDPKAVIGIMSDETPYRLLDENMSILLAKRLGDPDELVRDAAAFLLQHGGLAARQAVPTVLNFVSQKGPEEWRQKAAELLSYIADYTRIPELEELMKTMRSSRIRSQLRQAIERIRTLRE